MNTIHDYQKFIDELTEEVESGCTRECEEIVDYDTTRAVLNVMEMLQRWGVIRFVEEN